MEIMLPPESPARAICQHATSYRHFQPLQAQRLPETKSVGSLVRLPLPSRKNCQRLFAHKLSHRNAPRFRRASQLFINERIVKARVRRIGGNSSVEDARWTRPINRTQAHRTRLASGVKLAVSKLKCTERPAGRANRNDFGVRGGIVRSGDAVGAFTDYAAVLRHQRRKRSAASRPDIFKRERDGPAHKLCGHKNVPSSANLGLRPGSQCSPQIY